MPRTCTICSHVSRQAIDLALVSGIDSYRTIADRYAVSASAIKRHKENGHVSRKVTKLADVRDRIDAGMVLTIIEDMITESQDVLKAAKASNDLRTQLMAIRECRETASRLAELSIVADVEKRLDDLEKREGP